MRISFMSVLALPAMVLWGLCSYAKEMKVKDISSVLPQSKLMGNVVLPTGTYSGDLTLSLMPVKLSAKNLGDFVLKGRIIVDTDSDVTLENIVIDGSRPAGKNDPSIQPPQLLEIRSSKKVTVKNCSIFAFDRPFNPANPPEPSVGEEPYWNADGIRIENSENIVIDKVQVATQNPRIRAYNSKNITVKNSDFCATTAIGSQYKLFLRASIVYGGSPAEEFFNIDGLTLENNIFRTTSRAHFAMRVGKLSNWNSDNNIFWGMVMPSADTGGDRWNNAIARTLPIWREMSGKDTNSKTARIDYVINSKTGFSRDPKCALSGKPNISFSLPKDAADKTVSAGVFRQDGSLVRTLVSEYEINGAETLNLHWDGTDNLRHPVEPGEYIVKLYSAGLQIEQSWIGNTYGTFPAHVQQEICGIAVRPDGTCYGICYWDEAGAEIKKYGPDGSADILEHSELHGWGRFGSSEITADDKYIYLRMEQSGNDGGDYPNKNKFGFFRYPPKENTWECIRRYTLEGDPVPFGDGYGIDGSMLIMDEFPVKEGKSRPPMINGLLAAYGKLFVSDAKNNQVIAFDRDTLRKLQSWKVENPGRLAPDGKGSLWILDKSRLAKGEGDSRPAARLKDAESSNVQKLNLKTGSLTKFKLPGVVSPLAIAFDPKGRLMIGDDGPDMQIKIFDVSGKTPALVDTIGRKGGIYAGEPGRVAPDKLNGITGLGCDSSGNIYVSSNNSGAELRKFSPDKKLIWHLLGLAFVDGASADPESPEDVFMKDEHFKLDYSTNPVSWKYHAYTRDLRKKEAFENNRDWASNLIRRIDGRRFMFCTQMFPQTGLGIYRFEGEIALPAGFIKMEKEDAKVWHDANGDGKMDPAECQEPKNFETVAHLLEQFGDHGSWNWFVDTKGDIWKAYNTAGILHLPCQGLDSKGNPIYDLAKALILPMPEPFIELHSVEYIPKTDSFYLTGETEETKRNKADGWGPYDRVIARYDARMNLLWTTPPVDTILGLAISVTDDMLFSMESRTAQLQIYDNQTGLKLGTAAPGKPVGYASGWTDFPMCIRAMSLKTGESIVLVEEDWCAKIVIYRVSKNMQNISSVPFALKDAKTNSGVLK